MNMVLLFLTVVFTVLTVVFFITQWAEHGRLLFGVFMSSLSYGEFKTLIAIIKQAKMSCFSSNSNGIVFNNNTYKIERTWRNIYTVNGVMLSIQQEYKLRKTLERKVLEVNKLTKAGKALY